MTIALIHPADPNAEKYDRVQNAAGEFVPPQYGVGYGGQGTWLNQHFATLDEAQAFFDGQVAHLKATFPKGSITREIQPASLIRQFDIVNMKSNGKPGQWRQSVHLYRILP